MKQKSFFYKLGLGLLSVFFVVFPFFTQAAILSQQPVVNASFLFPDEAYYYGNLNLWTNDTAATTTIYAIYIYSQFNSSLTSIRVTDITADDDLGSTGNFFCLDKFGSTPSQILMPLRCVCPEYATAPEECYLPPDHTLQISFPWTGEFVHDNSYTIKFGGNIARALPFGSEWVYSNTVHLDNPSIVWPDPEFFHAAWFLCDDQATTTACADQFDDFLINIYTPPSGSSSIPFTDPTYYCEDCGSTYYAITNAIAGLFTPIGEFAIRFANAVNASTAEALATTSAEKLATIYGYGQGINQIANFPIFQILLVVVFLLVAVIIFKGLWYLYKLIR